MNDTTRHRAPREPIPGRPLPGRAAGPGQASPPQCANPPASDEQLVTGHLAGRDGDFELLVRRYAQELFHFLYRLLGSSATAEDIVQETFLQVHLSARSFDPGRRFRPWMFTIAANKARDALRNRRRRLEAALDDPADAACGPPQPTGWADGGGRPRPALALEDEERSLHVRRMVGQLPDHLREVVILGYYHGFAYREMAEILGVPLGTIKSRLHAAITALGGMRARVERPPSCQHPAWRENR